MKQLIIIMIFLSSVNLYAQSRSFYLGVGFRNLTKTLHPKTTDNVNLQSYESEIFYADGASIDLGYIYFPQDSFGINAGVSYGFPQQMSRGIQDGQETLITDTNIQVTDLILGTQYRDNRLYVPLGMVYSLFKYSRPSGSMGSAAAKGGVGYQAGLGFLANDRLSFEALYRATATTLNLTGTGFDQNFGNGELSYLTLIGKAYF